LDIFKYIKLSQVTLRVFKFSNNKMRAARGGCLPL